MGKKGGAQEVPANELTLEQARESYYEATGQTSDIARQLAFAGIAIMWVLAGESITDAGSLPIPDDLLRVGAVLVATLLLDLLQYIYRSVAWGYFSRRMEKRALLNAAAPLWINRWAIGLFIAKITAIACAYVLLGSAVLERLG